MVEMTDLRESPPGSDPGSDPGSVPGSVPGSRSEIVPDNVMEIVPARTVGGGSGCDVDPSSSSAFGLCLLAAGRSDCMAIVWSGVQLWVWSDFDLTVPPPPLLVTDSSGWDLEPALNTLCSRPAFAWPVRVSPVEG